jgi:tricorn protease
MLHCNLRHYGVVCVGVVAAVVIALASARAACAAFEPDALMMRYPDVSATQIVFTYDNNLWVAPKAGGTATLLASAPGGQSSAKFSADGASIAYVANYDGSDQVYILPVAGGVPQRLTWLPFGKSVTGFAPDGSVVYISWGELPHGQTLLYKISPQGGVPERLPLVCATHNSFSADGQWIAFCPWSNEGRTWHRYMGGKATDIWLFNLKTYESKQLTTWGGTDDMPMFDGDRIFYLSDAGPEHRRNIWVYTMKDGKQSQVTHFTEHETMLPNIGPGEIALENGGVLYLLGLSDLKLREVHIALPGDRPHLRPHSLDPSANLMSISVSPQGKRVVASLRGDIWTFPAEQGFPLELTRTDGSAERDPSWSPDGKWIVYLSDASGEYELYLCAADGSGGERRLTDNGACFRSNPCFSPDSKKITFSDKTGAYWVYILDTRETVKVDKDPWAEDDRTAQWAKDSNWLTYTIYDDTTSLSVIKLYSLQDRQSWQVTNSMFNSSNPAFDLSGDYLYFTTDRSFQPSYSETGDWGQYYFTNTGVMAVVTLRKDVKSPWAPKNDAEESKSGEPKDGAKPQDKETDHNTDQPVEQLKIDMDGIEGRTIQLPLQSGNYYNLAGGHKRIYYIRAPRSGSDGDTQWCYYDLGDDPKETVLLSGVNSFALTADAQKAMLNAQGGYFITSAAPGAALDKRLNLGGISVMVDPRSEWRQVVTDVWRLYRDYFYDPGMHGVDWQAVKERSLKLVDSAASRNDVTYIIGEMTADLNCSHTYVWGSGETGPPDVSCGMLGCDFAYDKDASGKPGWRIAKILHGAAWELDARSPLDLPGTDLNEGDFLLAVNGIAIDPGRGPYEALYGTAGNTAELTVNANAAADGKERKVLVTPMGYDGELRLRSWIEENRRYIYEKSGGKLGYLYVRDTSEQGVSDFERQFTGQHEMEGLIVDERWNGGGYSPDPMISILAREPRSYWATRDGHGWRVPWFCHPGPQVLLENEAAGSGGDNLPWLWRRYNLGPIIGTRTWGGSIAMLFGPALVDGSGFSVPILGFYDLDGTWALEGHGVDPDIPVVNDPTSLAKGQDKQLDTAIDVLLKELAAHPYQEPAKPPYPDRSGMGVPEQDW